MQLVNALHALGAGLRAKWFQACAVAVFCFTIMQVIGLFALGAGLSADCSQTHNCAAALLFAYHSCSPAGLQELGALQNVAGDTFPCNVRLCAGALHDDAVAAL